MVKIVKDHDVSFYINLLRQLAGLIVVMDKESSFIYSNNYTAKLFGYKNKDKMLGIDAYGMKCQAAESAPLMIEQDKIVVQTGNELTMLDVHKYAIGEPKILLTKKTPFRENGEIIGTICHCTEIHSDALRQACAALIESDKKYFSKDKKYERSYTLNSSIQKKQLSERESDCVFYLLRGYTIKQIAKFLNISPRTVETYIEQIKVKLSCSHKSDVIEYCIAEGLFNYIPNTFLNRNISDVIHVTSVVD